MTSKPTTVTYSEKHDTETRTRRKPTESAFPGKQPFKTPSS